MGTVPAVSPGTKETEGLSPCSPGINHKNTQEPSPCVNGCHPEAKPKGLRLFAIAQSDILPIPRDPRLFTI